MLIWKILKIFVYFSVFSNIFSYWRSGYNYNNFIFIIVMGNLPPLQVVSSRDKSSKFKPTLPTGLQ